MSARTDPQRRKLMLTLGALAAGGGATTGSSHAAERVAEDDAGRRVSIPSTPKRVFPAGAPAAVFVYCLVPDRLVGWPLDETMVDLFEWLYLHRPSIANMRDLLASARMRER